MSLSPAAPYDDASAPADDDFDSIEAAVLETPRGRWFLREFARRLKSAESDRVFEALARIERLIEETNAAARQPAPARPAPESPGQVADLRFAVRLVQLRLMDMAASMRAGGVDERFCEQVEQQARAFVEIASGRAPQAPAAPPAAPRPAAPPAFAPPPLIGSPAFDAAFPGPSPGRAAHEPLVKRAPPASLRYAKAQLPPAPPQASLAQPAEPPAPPETDSSRPPEEAAPPAIDRAAFAAIDALGPRERSALFA